MDNVSIKRLEELNKIENLDISLKLDKIIEYLKDDNVLVRKKAVSVLGVSQNEKAAIALIEIFISEKDNSVKEEIMDSLILLSDLSVKHMQSIINNENPSFRYSALLILGNIATIEASNLILPLIKDSDFAVKKQAIRSLGWCRNSGAVPILVDLLKDDEFEIRIEAAHALKNIKHISAIDPLLEIIKNEKYKTKVLAIWLLGEFKAKQAVVPLLSILESGNAILKSKIEDAIKRIATSTKSEKDRFCNGIEIENLKQEDSVFSEFTEKALKTFSDIIKKM